MRIRELTGLDDLILALYQRLSELFGDLKRFENMICGNHCDQRKVDPNINKQIFHFKR